MSDKTPDVKEPLATFKQRAMAGLVPDYLVPILLIICGSVLFAFASDALTIVAAVIVNLAAILQWAANFIFRVYKFRGQTMGKQRQHITTKKIVDKEKWILEDLGEGDIGLIIGRAIVSWIETLFIIPIIIPYLMINSSNNNQTLSDRLFGTVVVQIDPDEYDPKKKGEEDDKAVEGKTTTTKKTTDKKTTTSKTAQTVEGENNTLAMISKFVLIGGFILPILYLFLSFINSVLGTVWYSIQAWGGFWLFNGYILDKTVNAFGIISFICFFIITGAIFLLAVQYSDKIRTNLFVSGGLFGGFTIFWIIAMHANFDYVPFAFFGSGGVGISVGRVIFWILAVTALIISLLFFNNYIKLVNEEHGQEIPTFKGLIPLIVLVSLRFIIFLIGAIAVPTDAFGATIFYLNKLFVWMTLITMMITFAGFAFRALKLDTKNIPAKS
ncbi:MAG: RDD family protein [Candidatus Heimdallarchaeota archaeon]